MSEQANDPNTSTDSADQASTSATTASAVSTGTSTDATESPSIIPAENIPVDINDEHAAQLPAGTQVSMNADNQLVASVPHEGTVAHIVHSGEAYVEHLIETVRNYFASL